jgi:hypothetical protein
LDGQRRLRRLLLPLVELRAEHLISQLHVEHLINQQRLQLHVEHLINRKKLLPLAVLGTNNCLIVHGIPGGLFCRELFNCNYSQWDFDRLGKRGKK